MIGTFDYAAPEQLKEGPIDARTDVYALGGVLYQALTGKVPYPRETAAATMLAHLDAPPPSVLSVLPDASELLGEVVRRAMAKDPRDRYPSAGDLGRGALGAAQDRRTSTEERSVAAGAAAPDSVLHTEPPLPLPPALAVETGGGRFVGRAEQLDTLAAAYAEAERGRRRFVLLSGEPGIGKTRLATEIARRAHHGRRDRALRPQRPAVAAPLPAVHRRARPLGLAPRAPRPARRARARADRGRALRPRPAPPRPGAARDPGGGARDAPLPALRGRHPAVRVRRPRAPARPAARRPALGRPEHDAAARPRALRTPRRCGCSCSARRARSRASCSPGCAARAPSRSSSWAG